VRQITELLGGRISVSSEPGVGSRFEARLPLIAPDRAPVPAPVAMTPPATVTADPNEASEPGAPTVLIVEDDADTAAILANAATAAGYQIRLAADGVTGLRLAKSLLPAAVVLDVMMPGMDGWRVLQALRADAATADLPVVICSIVDNRALGYQMGASDYLVKPVDPSRLAAALTNVDLRKRADEGYVLVVDDEQSIRRLLATSLRDAGFSVSAVASGAAALRLAAVHPPRAIVTDLIMPGMSGFEFIARLRSTPSTAQTPIVVVTGRDLTPEDRRLLSGQIADVIRKGDLSLTDLEPHLRTTLETLGVRPSHGERSAD
jgi:DNA-binding response OmpR family regulator